MLHFHMGVPRRAMKDPTLDGGTLRPASPAPGGRAGALRGPAGRRRGRAARGASSDSWPLLRRPPPLQKKKKGVRGVPK